MKTFRIILKAFWIAASFTLMPCIIALVYDLNLLATFVTWDYILLVFYAEESDSRRGIHSKPSKILFPFPLYPEDYK